jgi:hypothetical protein
MIGAVSGKPWIDKAKNGRSKVVFLQVKFALDGDVRTVQYFPGSGVDDVPCEGDIVEVIRDGGILLAVSVRDSAEPKRKPGEKEIYSRDASGAKASRLLMTDKIYLGNIATDLCAVLLGIIDQIENLVTVGTPVSHTVSPPSVAALELYKQVIESLLAKEA